MVFPAFPMSQDQTPWQSSVLDLVSEKLLTSLYLPNQYHH